MKQSRPPNVKVESKRAPPPTLGEEQRVENRNGHVMEFQLHYVLITTG